MTSTQDKTMHATSSMSKHRVSQSRGQSVAKTRDVFTTRCERISLAMPNSAAPI